MMELFFQKNSIIDVWQASKYASVIFYLFLDLELTLSLDEGNAAGKRAFMNNSNTGSLENSLKTVLRNVTAGENPNFTDIIFFSTKVKRQTKKE